MRTGGLRSIWSNPISPGHTHPTSTHVLKNLPTTNLVNSNRHINMSLFLHLAIVVKVLQKMMPMNDQLSNPRSTFLKMVPLGNTLMVLTQNDDPSASIHQHDYPCSNRNINHPVPHGNYSFPPGRESSKKNKIGEEKSEFQFPKLQIARTKDESQ